MDRVSTTSVPVLDAHRLRADFPVFEELFDGKPVAYLDSASSAQKPRQVLDRMRAFYEHEYANVHRGVYRLSERATEAFEAARRTVASFLNAPSEKEVIFTRNATEGLNLVAYAWGLDNLGPGDVVVITELEHHAELRPVAVHRVPDRRELPPHPDRRPGRAAARRARRPRARGQREGRREQPRLEHARDDQPRRRARGVGARAGGDHGRRRGAGRTAPRGRRPGARRRLRRDHRPQDLRADAGSARSGGAGSCSTR